MSSAIKFSFDLKPIQRELRNLSGANKEKFNRAVLIDSQDILLNYIKQLAPRKSGDYARSWKKGMISKNTAKVTTTLSQLFEILEFTGAKPQNRVRTGNQKPYVFKDENGITVFTFKINWPGFDNIPHVRPAMRRLEKDFPIILAANSSKFSIIFNKVSNENKSKVKQLKKKKITKTKSKQSKSQQMNKRGSIN